MAREALEAPKMIKTIATVVGCMPVLKSKTPFLMTLHALAVRVGEIKLGLSWKHKVL